MRFICILACMFSITQATFADNIVLENGDKITGKIINLINEQLKIKTNYAGILKIDATKILSINTTKPQQILWKDGSISNIALKPDNDGGIYLNKPLPKPFWETNLYWIPKLLNLNTDNPKIKDTPYLPNAISEIKAINADTSKWCGYLLAGGNYSSGNTNRRNFDFATEFKRDLKHASIAVKYRGEFAKEENQTTASNNFLFGKYEYNLNTKIFTFASEELSNDKFTSMKLKSISSGGSGFRFFNSKNFKLSSDIGLSYLHKNQKDFNNSKETTTRLGIDISFKLNQRISLADNFYSNRTTKTHKTFSRNEISLDTILIEDWILNITHIYDYESSTSESITKHDKRLIFGVKYSF